MEEEEKGREEGESEKEDLSTIPSFEVPEDVMIQILSFLPVKSLMRYKCVCKSWCTLIESLDFITKHLNQATLENNAKYGLQVKYSHRDADAFFLLSDETYRVSATYTLPSSAQVSVTVLDSCNGIVLLKLLPISIKLLPTPIYVLWNPATRALRNIPDSPNIPLFSALGFDRGVGISFDVKSNDYRVVRILQHNEQDTYQVEMYNLSTDSWRLIDASMPSSKENCGFFSTYQTGSYYWLFGRYSLAKLLLAFDMNDEVIRDTHMPNPYMNFFRPDHDRYTLTVLNESIALICPACSCWNSRGVAMTFEVWVLNNYGMKEPWTKLYQTPVTPCMNNISRPLEFSKNGELILNVNAKRLALYNPATGAMRKISLGDATPTEKSMKFLFYKESLVSIEGGKDRAKMKKT